MKLVLASIFSLLLFTGATFAGDTSVSAKNTVSEFYNYRVHQLIYGAPAAAQLLVLKRWLSPRLCAQLEKADKERRDFMKKHGDSEKPPWCEGDLFSSTFEGPSSYEIAGGVSEKGKALVQVVFSSTEPHAKTFRWADRVQLKEIDGKWLIDDILYDLPVEFGNRGTLRATLP